MEDLTVRFDNFLAIRQGACLIVEDTWNMREINLYDDQFEDMSEESLIEYLRENYFEIEDKMSEQ